MFLSFFLIALMYHFEVTVMFAFLAYSLLFLVLVDRKTKPRGYLYLISALLLGFMPALMFELRHQFLQTKTVLRFLTGEETSLSSPGFMTRSLWQAAEAPVPGVREGPCS